MKKLLLPLVALVLCMTACQKDDADLLSLEIEHFSSDAKMHIDGRDFAVWDDNDVVWLNENEKRVTVDNANHRATIPVDGETPAYYASYPYKSIRSAPYEISMPEVQTYEEVNGSQKVAAPMFAYATDAPDNNILKFRNVGSVLAVKVINNTYNPLRIYRIQVTSDDQNLWGSGRILIRGTSAFTCTDLTNGGNTVILKCDGGVEVPAGGKIFYIALPVISNAKLTVKVDDGYGIYTRAQTSSTATFERNTIHQVPFSTAEDIYEPYSARPKSIRYTAASKLTGFEPEATVWGKTVLRHDYDATRKQGTITFNSDITEIPNNAFERRNELLSIILPESVETIGVLAFYESTLLNSVSMPGVTLVKSGAFSNCTALTTLKCENVSRIEASAFYESGLQTITLGPNISSLGVCIFRFCDHLTDIYCKAQYAPVSDIEDDEGEGYRRHCFTGMPNTTILHVPSGRGAHYAESHFFRIAFGQYYGPGTRILEDCPAD